MNARFATTLLMLMWGLCSYGCRESQSGDTDTVEKGTREQIKKAFMSLHKGATKDQLNHGLAIIYDAGAASFPVLLDQLNNEDPASSSFTRMEHLEHDPKTGKLLGWRDPTMGEVAFMLLQGEVERGLPPRYQQYHVLTPKSARKWFTAHKGSSIPELRITAATEALKAARQDFANDPDEWNKEAVEYLTGNLENVRVTKRCERANRLRDTLYLTYALFPSSRAARDAKSRLEVMEIRCVLESTPGTPTHLSIHRADLIKVHAAGDIETIMNGGELIFDRVKAPAGRP